MALGTAYQHHPTKDRKPTTSHSQNDLTKFSHETLAADKAILGKLSQFNKLTECLLLSLIYYSLMSTITTRYMLIHITLKKKTMNVTNKQR